MISVFVLYYYLYEAIVYSDRSQGFDEDN